ncbi:MAG: CoA pyrophosphatase [Synechococcaceae cyanobacterium SM1_2_3]|nr:CoA pyrophosphatase [Synechococcaceae cyanobacterium SM1_2_3]
MEREERMLTRAAVLVPLVDRPEGYTVLLTQRTAHLEHHAGQISFPGGRAEDEDASPVHTALREAEEEIGLHRRHVVEIAGFLDLYQTVTGFLVTPVVGFVDPSFVLRLDPFEVAEAFEAPLEFLLDPNHHEQRSLVYNGQQRRYYVIPYQDRNIWGATAAMLVDFSRRLAEHSSLSL